MTSEMDGDSDGNSSDRSPLEIGSLAPSKKRPYSLRTFKLSGSLERGEKCLRKTKGEKKKKTVSLNNKDSGPKKKKNLGRV